MISLSDPAAGINQPSSGMPAVQVKIPQREQASSASKDAMIAALRQRIKKLEEENRTLKQQMEVANGLLYQQEGKPKR